MKQVARNFVSTRLALVIFAFALVATSGFTCAKVTDPIGNSSDNGLAPGGGGFGDPFPERLGGIAACVGQCTSDAKRSRLFERQLHHENLAQCGGNKDCIKAENARHAARMQEINQIQKDCIADCHNQGGGSGGE